MQTSENTPSFDEPDRSRINVDQEQERRYWTGRFGVTRDVLRRAVTRNAMSLSWANFASNARSRSSKVVMRYPWLSFRRR
jgi:hypothetical protein